MDANTHATYYCYLPATDQVSAAFDALGHERQSSYTPDYNVATLIDPLTNLSTFTWSADGKNNLAGVSDATGAVTTFGYGTGNLYLPTRTTDPQGMVLAYTYDSPGNLTTVKDNTNNQNLLSDSYTYNSTPSALNGTLATATNGNGRQTTFGYDSFGNLTSVTPPSGGVLGATSLTYDGVSRVSSVTDGRGLVTSFSYDGDDRITTITYPNGVTQTITYDGAGRELSVIGTHGSTTLTSFTYCYRPIPTGSTNCPTSGTPTNLRTLVTDGVSHNVTKYTYDTQNRLTEAKTTSSGGSTVSDYSYTYDAASNLTGQTAAVGGSTTSVSYIVDPDNAVTAETTNGTQQTFGYDGDGNLTSWSGGWSLSYNAKNQTTSVTNGGQSQNYTYSGPDQRALLSATSSAVTLQFANSALGETYQQGTDSSYTRAFARDNRGALVSKAPSAGQYYFYLFDGLGSVAAVTDPSGNVAASYQYDPYGNVTSQTGSLYNPFQYASGWVSGITSFTHFGARWYAPATQLTRWTQQDPVAGSLFQPTSQCRYAYASDDPVNLVDPSGRLSAECINALVTAGIEFIGGVSTIGAFVALAPATGGISLAIGALFTFGGGVSLIAYSYYSVVYAFTSGACKGQSF